MDLQNTQDEPVYLRHRSPTFSKDETQTLVNLVAKYKNVINNKSYNNMTLHAKEVAWSKISKIFNSQGFKHNRSVECLKIKWVNLKKDARKVSKNLMEGQTEFDELTSQVVSMVCEAENCTNEIIPQDLEDEENESQKEVKDDCVKLWENSRVKEENKTDSKMLNKEKYVRCKKRINRSMNFTPQECRLLLQCVRREKKYVFIKGNSARALALKQRAWSRITHFFNKQSPQKRSTMMLRNKLRNMKNLARKEGSSSPENNKKDVEEDYSQYENDEEECQKIKSEPIYDESDQDSEGDFDDKEDAGSKSGLNNSNSFDGLCETTEHIQVDPPPDPLCTILNGDSGIGSINMEALSTENSEVTKLKIELLKYQLENAKLERKRIEEASLVEAKLNEARATETALRLRAARLAAVAAAAALAPAHPALHYAPDELRAQHYIEQYHPT